MTSLTGLRAQLQSLRTARSAVRGGSALAAVLSVALASLLAAWGLDLLFHWDRASRAVLLLAWLAAMVWWGVRRFAPLVGRHESLEQLALWVERQHRLDGDLVSALQFEHPDARRWGSPRLTAAVVDYVAEFSRGLNVFDGFTWETLPRRLALLTAILIAGAGLCAASPEHASVFWNRFWLGASRYPTRTILTDVTINGRRVEAFSSDRITVAIAQNEPLQVVVKTRGEPPESAVLLVRGQRTGERGQWPLVADDAGYRYAQASLSEGVRLWVRAGDAESDAIDLNVVPLPMVDLRWSVTPPSYARSTGATEISAGTRSFAALAGSRVSCSVTSANKRLQSAALKLSPLDPTTDTETASTTVTVELVPDAKGVVWTLSSAAVLARLQEPLRYELMIVDVDGLTPQPAILGEIRLQSDRPPRVSATAISRKVLPQAQPRISYGAADDYGLGELRLEWDVIAENGPRRSDQRVLQPRSVDKMLTTIRGETAFDLSSLGVSRGDEVRVYVVAEDQRGDAAAQAGRSEPVIFAITDKAGILESLLEIDQQSAQQLDAIIEKELGIGGAPR